jgi:hypothetical protein
VSFGGAPANNLAVINCGNEEMPRRAKIEGETLWIHGFVEYDLCNMRERRRDIRA